jgi:deoxyribodipyrimidine photo-lyase
VLFTRDLRVRDNPALAAACEQADLVVPLFAVDAGLRSAAPNRARFLRRPSPICAQACARAAVT